MLIESIDISTDLSFEVSVTNSGEFQEVGEQLGRLVDAAGAGEGLDQPERTGEEGAFGAGQAVLAGRVAVQQGAAGAELVAHGRDRGPDPGRVARFQAQGVSTRFRTASIRDNVIRTGSAGIGYWGDDPVAVSVPVSGEKGLVDIRLYALVDPARANGRPLPELTPATEWFWTSGADGVLRVQAAHAAGMTIRLTYETWLTTARSGTSRRSATRSIAPSPVSSTARS